MSRGCKPRGTPVSRLTAESSAIELQGHGAPRRCRSDLAALRGRRRRRPAGRGSGSRCRTSRALVQSQRCPPGPPDRRGPGPGCRPLLVRFKGAPPRQEDPFWSAPRESDPPQPVWKTGASAARPGARGTRCGNRTRLAGLGSRCPSNRPISRGAPGGTRLSRGGKPRGTRTQVVKSHLLCPSSYGSQRCRRSCSVSFFGPCDPPRWARWESNPPQRVKNPLLDHSATRPRRRHRQQRRGRRVHRRDPLFGCQGAQRWMRRESPVPRL